MSTFLAPLFLSALLAAAPALAQTPPQTPAPAPKAEPEFVQTRDFKSRVFVLKHRSAFQLSKVLWPLGSGFKGAAIQPAEQEGTRTITVRDFPENLGLIEEALGRLDVPAQASREVELRLHVLFASRRAGGPAEALPEDLKPVVAALRSTLNYRTYTLATSFVQRATSGTEFLRGIGQTTLPSRGEAQAPVLEFTWDSRTLKTEAPPEGPTTIVLGGFHFWVKELSPKSGFDRGSLSTNLTLKDGEQVVVGTSVIGDMDLIVVLSGKILK